MLLIIGPTGVGKSEQTELMEQQGLIHWISIGKLLRKYLVGDEKARLDRGELISDSVVIDLIKKELASYNDEKPVVLDGFPRSMEQVDWLFSNDNPDRPTVAVWLEAKREILYERLLKRKRLDDKSDIINHRLDIYETEIGPIVARLTGYGLPIIKIDSNRTISEVTEDIIDKLIVDGHINAN